MSQRPTATTWSSTVFVDPGRSWSARASDWFTTSRAHRVFCIVVAIWVLNAFDLALTLLANNLGVLHEDNPLAVRFLENGTLSVLLYKVGLVLMGSYPLLRFRNTRIAELGALVVLVVYAMLAVRWSACYDIYAYTIHSGFPIAEAK